MSNTSEDIGSRPINDLIGDPFLFASSMFIELTVVLTTLMLIYNTIGKMWHTRSFVRYNDPIQINRWMVICFSGTLFLRAVTDAVILLTWQEVEIDTLLLMSTIDRVFSIIAMIPFIAGCYLLFRAGPSIDFQLLRQPIPTDLWSTWKALKKPFMVIAGIFSLCLIVTIAKM